MRALEMMPTNKNGSNGTVCSCRYVTTVHSNSSTIITSIMSWMTADIFAPAGNSSIAAGIAHKVWPIRISAVITSKMPTTNWSRSSKLPKSRTKPGCGGKIWGLGILVCPRVGSAGALFIVCSLLSEVEAIALFGLDEGNHRKHRS